MFDEGLVAFYTESRTPGNPRDLVNKEHKEENTWTKAERKKENKTNESTKKEIKRKEK